MENKLILTEHIKDNNPKLLSNPIIDGENISLMRSHLIEANDEAVASSILNNAYKCLNLLANPYYHSENGEKNLSKILCLGRVQSGKTGFFISTIALAFDNGYDIAYLIGGTKNTLKEQNHLRVDDEFSNNINVKIYDIKKIKIDVIKQNITDGYKIVLVSLKNVAERANMGKISTIANELHEYPSIIIDDEGDEYTPGAPNLRANNPLAGRTHDLMANIIYAFDNASFLSVTATPQANFLLSTIDDVSPDYAVLVEPGSSYTGGNAFHDSMDNPHVVTINDFDDFKTTVPQSFYSALNFFVFSCCLMRARKSTKDFSMMIHPSSFTVIHNDILTKIQSVLDVLIPGMKNLTSYLGVDIKKMIIDSKNEYLRMNNIHTLDVTDQELFDSVSYVADQLKIFVFNNTSIGKNDIEIEKNDKHKYKIYVGGNMLGRGLTIKNLNVSYFYRDSKETAIDTLYQRARWLGYKRNYFDICRVYMSEALKEKFIAITENENDMWDSLNTFLRNDLEIKKFPRIFTLNTNQKLILTRKTISKTVIVDRINAGLNYDKSVTFDDKDKISNRNLYKSYYKENLEKGYPKCYSNNGYQEHFIIPTRFTKFYDEFLSKYSLPKHSNFGYLGFEKILKQIYEGTVGDELTVIIMRHKVHEYRSANKVGSRTFIGELLQSYDNGTEYPGDRNLSEFSRKMFFQIHLVYTDKTNPDDYVPILVFNNPISDKTIKFVTGENYYGI